MTRSSRRRTVRAARVSAHTGILTVCLGTVSGPFHREAGTTMGLETIVIVVIIVLIVLFVLGYFGRGRRA